MCQAFIRYNCDDHGIQLMKTPNSQSQKIRILNEINKTRIANRTILDLWKVEACICTQYLVWAPFASITASMQRGMDAISLWHCWGVMEDQDASIAAFSSSALLGLMSLIFLLAMPHRFSMGFTSGEFAGQSSTVTLWTLNQVFGTFGSVGRCQVLLENEVSIPIKLVWKEAWSAPKSPGRWLRWP